MARLTRTRATVVALTLAFMASCAGVAEVGGRPDGSSEGGRKPSADSGKDTTVSADAGDGAFDATMNDGDSDASPEENGFEGEEGMGSADEGVADAGPSPCESGASGCSGNTPETCAAGVWEGGAPCTGDAMPFCNKGSCSAEPPSCAAAGPGKTNCGASGEESCCTSLEVPGGTFYRTYSSSDGGVAENLGNPATVSSFKLDKYDVTVGRFRSFVAAWHVGYRPPPGSGKHTHLNGGNGLVNSATELPDGGPETYETGWRASDNDSVGPTSVTLGPPTNYSTWSAAVGDREDYPINYENWYQAYAFCIWDGGFLPSEAETEYAAAGGSEQREYPWGVKDPGTDSKYAIYYCYYPPRDSGPPACSSVVNTAPVGTAALGVGAWGQLDLAGNIDKWTVDWFETYVDPCVDCAYLTPTSVKVVRGGYFGNPSAYLHPSFRYANPPLTAFYSYGVRCARVP
jgi:formylglycine-generating enzyme